MSLTDGRQAFKAGYIQLQQDMLTRDVDSFKENAERMTLLIEAFIKSADVKIGISVSTTGTATAQTGKTTTKGKLE